MKEKDAPFSGSLLEKLPSVRGRLTANAPLATASWFRVGGPAEVLFQPEDAQDLAAFLKDCPADVALTVLGACSNTLIRDGGVRGVVIKLGPRFAAVSTEGDVLRAGAGALDLNVARAARDAGLSGLEFLSGIPGTIGGALRMNAGAHGSEIKDILIEAEAVTRAGGIITLPVSRMGLSYRHSSAPEDLIYLKASFKGTADAPEAIDSRMKEIAFLRNESQPVRSRTGGSTFANPEGMKAWKLIDEAGGRGLRVGGAKMSEKHCNFMINEGDATAADLESLGEEIRRRVKEKSGIELSWEIRRIGEPAPSSTNE